MRAPAHIRKTAQQLIASGQGGDDLRRRDVVIGREHIVVDSNRMTHSWFVPVTVGDRLAGFFQFLPNGSLMRFSMFPHRPDDFTQCPATKDWLDPKQIRERAASQAHSNDTVGDPFLTFDRTPDRLAWAVPIKGATNQEHLVFVAGTAVFTAGSGETVD